MKIDRRTGGADERLVLIGMVTNATVLARVASVWPATQGGLESGLFANKYANLIGRLCVHYWAKYGNPPSRDIEGLFRVWAEAKERDPDLVKATERVLHFISDEYESTEGRSADYILDLAGNHFRVVALTRLAESIKGGLALDEPEEAMAAVTAFSAPELGVGTGLDYLADADNVFRDAFERELEVLVEWEGALGQFLNRGFYRDGFVSFMGPEKRGKTWWLIEVLSQAMRQGRRVAFFSIGDMSEQQMLLRLGTRLAGRPRQVGTYHYPVSITKDDEGTVHVETEERHYDDPLGWRLVVPAAERVMRFKKEGPVKLFTYPNGSVTANHVRAALDRWAVNKWVPDLVIIDYADLFEPIDAREESRHQINRTWKYMRRMSQEIHGCVVTATQSDSASYEKHVLTKANFSDCKGKLAHVTGMLGLNMTAEEKTKGIMRLNWIVNREEAWTEYQCVTVAGQYHYGRPAILSCL